MEVLVNVVSVSGDGYGFEVEVCGCSFPDVNPKHRRNRRISLAGAMRYVISIQWKLGCNPCRPKTKLAKAVFDRISTRLRLAGRKEKLKFFVCVGTCMDCLGVDCFFRCGNRIVTIDLYSGRRKYKGGKIKADMVLSRQHFLKDEHYKVADEIARRLAA